MSLPRQHAAGLTALLALGFAGCDGDAAPPEPGEGAVGMVSQENAGAAENPITPPLSGGMAGQTPAYPAPAGVPSIIHNAPDADGPTVANNDPPIPE